MSPIDVPYPHTVQWPSYAYPATPCNGPPMLTATQHTMAHECLPHHTMQWPTNAYPATSCNGPPTLTPPHYSMVHQCLLHHTMQWPTNAYPATLFTGPRLWVQYKGIWGESMEERREVCKCKGPFSLRLIQLPKILRLALWPCNQEALAQARGFILLRCKSS